MAKRRIKAFIPVHIDGEDGFASVEQAIEEPDVALQVTEYALAKLEAWHKEWALMLKTIQQSQPSALGEVVQQIISDFQRIKRANKQHWPY